MPPEGASSVIPSIERTASAWPAQDSAAAGSAGRSAGSPNARATTAGALNTFSSTATIDNHTVDLRADITKACAAPGPSSSRTGRFQDLMRIGVRIRG